MQGIASTANQSVTAKLRQHGDRCEDEAKKHPGKGNPARLPAPVSFGGDRNYIQDALSYAAL